MFWIIQALEVCRKYQPKRKLATGCWLDWLYGDIFKKKEPFLYVKNNVLYARYL